MAISRLNKARKRTPGFLWIILDDGIALKLKNMWYSNEMKAKLVKYQYDKHKIFVLDLVNRKHLSHDEYKFKRRGGNIYLVHRSKDSKLDEYF